MFLWRWWCFISRRILGLTVDTGEKLVIRSCAPDSGTLTIDTELVRMSHCGSFIFDERYFPRHALIVSIENPLVASYEQTPNTDRTPDCHLMPDACVSLLCHRLGHALLEWLTETVLFSVLRVALHCMDLHDFPDWRSSEIGMELWIKVLEDHERGLELKRPCIEEDWEHGRLMNYFADDTGESIVVRSCALDSGSLTTDTEIIRMSHCGGYYFEGRYRDHKFICLSLVIDLTYSISIIFTQ